MNIHENKFCFSKTGFWFVCLFLWTGIRLNSLPNFIWLLNKNAMSQTKVSPWNFTLFDFILYHYVSLRPKFISKYHPRSYLFWTSRGKYNPQLSVVPQANSFLAKPEPFTKLGFICGLTKRDSLLLIYYKASVTIHFTSFSL